MCLRNKCPGFIYFLAPGVCRKAGWQEFIRCGAGGPSPQVPAKHGDRSQLHPHQTSVLSFNWSHQRQSTWLDSCWCMFQGTNKRRGVWMLCDDHRARGAAGGLLVWPQVRPYHSLLSSRLLSYLESTWRFIFFSPR